MNTPKNIFTKLLAAMKKHKVISLVIFIVILGYVGYKFFSSSKSSAPQYQTGIVERGMLITSITASGTITSGDTTYITTGASGTVSKVNVKNGDKVLKGQKLAEITLDDIGQETQITAWNNYQESLVTAKNSRTQKETDNITMLEKKQTMLNLENAKRDSVSGGWNPSTKAPYTDSELVILNKQYDEAVAAYQAAISNNSISDTGISLSGSKSAAAYRNYQKVSSTVYSPASGILQNLTLAPGVVLSNSSNSTITVSAGTDTSTNSQSVASKQIGAIKNPDGKYQATVSLTEVDVTKVESGQKVSLTLDAFLDATLTGEVLAINTSGTVSSGVTSYSATILIDKTTLNIYTNMAANAKIITSTKDNVLMVPSSAVQTTNGTKSVRILVNGKLQSIPVEVGSSNDTQAEIISGLNEGDAIVTTVISATKSTTTTTVSPFGNIGGSSGGARNFGGGMGR
jgi:multidrug efflux pump subunit AcrA (membrane-fusion protein)